MSRIRTENMTETGRLSDAQARAAKARRLEAMHLQEIEDNPLDAEQIAMFEMFEREKWSHERRRGYIAQRAKERVLEAAE